MEKTIVYRRDGKFGNEFFIALENLRIIQCKETEKAYACGSFNTVEQYVDGWIAKSLCKEIEGKMYCPTWVLKWTDITKRIVNDYYHEEFEVREFSREKEPEKSEPEKPIEEDYCVYENFDGSSVNGVNSSFGKDWRKGSSVKKRKEIEGGVTLFLLSCYDKYEDGYCVFACNEKSEISDPNRGHFWKYKIISEAQFRGNCEYPSKYANEFAGEKTFEKISKLEDFENLKNNIYYFVEN